MSRITEDIYCFIKRNYTSNILWKAYTINSVGNQAPSMLDSALYSHIYSFPK